MNDYVTIATFTYPSETAVIKGKLESEGIECVLKDELTAQVHNFLSNAIGGIKLQVKREEAAKAIQILKEAGYLREENAPPSKFFQSMSAFSAKIPFLNRLAVELRLVILLAIIVSGFILGALAWLAPTTTEYLTQNTWCVRYVTYMGVDYKPVTHGLKLIGAGMCEERIHFKPSGEVVLPGFNSLAINGKWVFQDGNIVIAGTDTLQHLYNGTYAIEKSNNGLTLTSENTTFHCIQSKWRWTLPIE